MEKITKSQIDKVMEIAAEALSDTEQVDLMSAPGADRRAGIVIITFPFNNARGGQCNFISNGADRKDLAVLFRERAAKMEGQAEVIPGRIH